MTTHTLCLDSPLGPLTVTETDGALTALDWRRMPRVDESPLLAEAARQLCAYFAGALRAFDLPLAPQGTPHQRAIWRTMQTIPFGATMTYGEVATAVGSAPRAVGTACGRNPLPIIIPCHRVLAAGGRLGGYSGTGGLATKRFLLALEGASTKE